MKVRYQYRIYPTSVQQRSLAQLFGCVRVVWNDALALCKYDGVLKVSALQKLFITLAKKTKMREWLKDVSNIPLQQSVADLGVAYQNFFKHGQGYPKFKKHSNQQSARFRKGGFSIKKGKVYLAKIGLLSTKWSRELPAEASSVTVIKDCANRYFLSFVVDIEPITESTLRESIGVDLGIKVFAALSTGKKVLAPNLRKIERKIERFQGRHSKALKGGKRRELLRLKIAKLHCRLADKRKDFLHKLSTKLVSENRIVVLEDLNVSGMVRNHKLARAISRQGWSMFRTMCEAKSNQYADREFRVIGRWEPTSQTCSSCGYRWGKLDLSIRTVVCASCGETHCRDGNAAKNIQQVGVGHTHDSERVRSSKRTVSDGKTASAASCSETSTHKIEKQLSLF